MVQFGSFTINTDYSYWPVTNTTTVYGAFVDRAIDQHFEIRDIMMQPFIVFNLVMNRRMIYLNRQIGKIDAALSYVGGLLAIVVAFIGFFVMSYNRYRYEIMVA